MKNLVVFDWNGTLLADTAACMHADNHVLETFGGKKVTLNEYRDTIIIPAIQFYTQHGCSEEELRKDSARLGKVFHESYEPRVAQCRTRRGVRNILSWLQEHEIESIILSNHTVEGITMQLERLKIAKYVKDVLANSALDSSMKGRNKKEKLEVYLSNHQKNPDNALIIGDSPEETEIGRHLGLTTVAITGGYYSEQRLRKVKPDYLIHNIGNLPRIIEEES